MAPVASCQAITVPLCKDLHYTETVLPNILGHNHQDDASLQIYTFAPLIQVACSPHLKPFLCSVYTPECVSGTPQPPCRTLCEKARTGCESLLQKFGFHWPEALRCETFTTESCEHVSVIIIILEHFLFPMLVRETFVGWSKNRKKHAFYPEDI